QLEMLNIPMALKHFSATGICCFFPILFAVDHHSGSEEQQPGEEYFDPETYDIRHGRMDTFPLFRNAIIDAGLENTVVPIVARSAVAALPWRPLAGF
ncbi:hypothetical protein MUP29_10930, partial [bacterium]|nr:hypothetical protein [bacterium]